MKQFLEMCAHRPVRYSESPSDFLIGESIRGKAEDLRLAGRQPTRAEIGAAVPTSTVSAMETTHCFSPAV